MVCEPVDEKVDKQNGPGGPISEAYAQVGSDQVEGRLDPQKPDTLAGKDVSGDLASGRMRVEWSLKFVTPKSSRK
jgi:hypothetical protein